MTVDAIRVLQVIPTLSAGGAEGFVANLSVHMAAAGADVRVLLLGGSRDGRGATLERRLSEAAIEVIGREERAVGSARNLLRLAGEITSWKPSVVQANLPAAEVACAVARPLTAGASSLFARRLANTERFASGGWKEMCLAQAFELTVACSPAVAERHLRRVGRRGRLETIPNGGHLVLEDPTPEQVLEARRGLGLPGEAHVVVHIGRMWPGPGGGGLSEAQKAHDVAVRAFAAAFGDDDQARLVLVGGGPLRGALEELVRRLGVSPQVHFLGETPEPWPALISGDTFLFPSRHEGLPNVLLEAASCCLPVVASDIPEIRFIAPQSGWTLVGVDDVEGFAAALANARACGEQLRPRAARTARDFRSAYSMEVCADRYLRAYRDLVEAHA